MIYLDDMPLSGSAAFAALLECDFRSVTAMRSLAAALDRACTCNVIKKAPAAITQMPQELFESNDLFQESVDDLFFSFGLGESEGHELDDLFAGDLADGSLVNEGSLCAVGFEGRNSEDAALIHDDGIALGVAVAGGIAENAHIKLLIGFIACDRTGDDIRAGVIAVEDDLINTVGILCSVGHQTLLHDQARTGTELGLCITFGGIDTLDLHHFHLHGAVLFHIDLCAGIEQALAGPVAGAVVLLDILDLCALADKEAVDTVMLGILCAAVVDAAACDDHDIAVLADVKIVVDDFLESALAHDDRDMDTLILCAGLNLDVDAGSVLLGNDIDVGSRVAHGGFAVGTNVKSAFRHSVQVCNLLQESLLYFVNFSDFQHVYLQSVRTYRSQERLPEAFTRKRKR